MRIGLLGGSFNPPHEGHIHISLIARETLKLDFIWWLVSPNNPLKDAADLLPGDERLAQCLGLTRDHPEILVTDIERQLGVNRSYDSIRTIKGKFPRTSFVWITGMDNALIFHRWQRWRDILKEIATAHIARPPALTLIEQCPLRMLATQKHRCLHRAEKADLSPGHTYWLLQRRMLGVSSTEIRENAAGQDSNPINLPAS